MEFWANVSKLIYADFLYHLKTIYMYMKTIDVWLEVLFNASTFLVNIEAEVIKCHHKTSEMNTQQRKKPPNGIII